MIQTLHGGCICIPFITLQINNLLKFIILYFNNFILPRTRYLCVTLVRHNELPEDDILNVETCRSMLFVIIVFYIIVQSLVKLQIITKARYWYQNIKIIVTINLGTRKFAVTDDLLYV